MSIDMIGAGLKALKPIEPVTTPKVEGVPKPGAAQGTSFKDMFSEAIGEVDKMQKDANQSIQDLALGQNGATTHSTMIALEKADTAFQLMNAIRAKIVRAYEDVIRTQV